MEQTARPEEPPFFAIGLWKLGALLAATFGVYQLVWLFSHWGHRRDAWGEQISPAFRTLMLPMVYIFPLAHRFGNESRLHPVAGHALTLGAAALWLLLTLASWATAAPVPFALLPAVPIVVLQVVANRANRLACPSHNRNTRLGGWSIVVVFVGGLLVALATWAWLYGPPEGGR